MARTLQGELRRINLNLLNWNILLLLASLGIACLPSFMGLGAADGARFWWYSAIPPALLALWNLEKWFKRRQEVEAHPFYEIIKNQGTGAWEALERDLEKSQDFFRLTLGPAWLLQRGFFSLVAASLAEVVWAYRRESHSEFLIYSQVLLRLRSGKSLSGEMSSNTKKITLFLETLSQYAPWVIIGESDFLDSLWKKDKAGFVAQVDQRKKVLEARKKTGE